MKAITKAVILVIVHKSELTANERISLSQCSKILGRHPIVFICPKGLNVSQYKELIPSATFDFINPVWQCTYARFNRLKIHPFLYNRYKSYEYILFYEPDAFVFEDHLEHWCNQGYDYIGAPWIQGFENGDEQSPFLGVGNGGFSLRKVSSHLKALRSFSYRVPIKENLRKRFIDKIYGNNFLRQIQGFLLDCTIRNNTFWLFNDFSGLEDQFWGLHVASNFSWFKVPSVRVAAAFSMEMQPGRVFEINNRKLPFGCHAWAKYEPSFWKPHFEKIGYSLSDITWRSPVKTQVYVPVHSVKGLPVRKEPLVVKK